MIKYLKVINWKCFEHKEFDFEKQNIITQPNGSGKSSIFQAIIFGMFGKMPPGFNLNTLRRDPDKECLVHLEFEYLEKGESHRVVIKRQFGRSSLIMLKDNNDVIATSSKEAFSYIDNIYPYEVLSVLWSPHTLSASSILKPDFLVNSLLNYIFKDAKYLQSHYKKEQFAQNKVVKNLFSKIPNIKNIDSELESVVKEIGELKKSLHERSGSNDQIINRARIAESAQNELEGLEGDLIELDLCNKYRSFVGSKDPSKLREITEQKIETEKSKITSDIFKVPNSAVNLILELSMKREKCLVCDSEWDEEHAQELRELLKKGSPNFKLIESMENDLKLLDIDKEAVERTLKHHNLRTKVSECPNFKEILSSYDKNNEEMWKKLETLENKKNSLEKIIEFKRDYLKEKIVLESLTEKIEYINEFIDKANEYYSVTMVQEASDILNKLNPRYDQIILDEGTYKVSVIDAEMGSINLLPVVQLSSGEKTLVGVSLILSSHKLFLPKVPLLFDESFSALDIENISSLKNLFKSFDVQTFIITHDLFWLSN